MALIKCLNLNAWMTEDWTLDDCLSSGRYEEIKPRVKRPGRYYAHLYDGAWFETLRRANTGA